MIRVVVLALACSCFISPVIPIGSGKSAREAQHDTLGELMPPVLSTDRTWTGELRVQKIRVWADDEYRAQNIHWQKTFGEQLEYANAVLAPVLGLKLVAEYHEWTHHAPGFTLAEHLAQLAREDPGDGVLSVVGLTSSLGLVSATYDQLGYASEPGRHMILRGYADVEERNAFARAFRDVPADERDNVLEARRRHKTTTVLLHELGHNLGAPHEDDSDTIMNAMYSVHAAAFTEHSRALMLATLGGKSGAPIATVAATHATQLVLTIVESGQPQLDGKTLDAAALDALFRAQDRDTEIVVNAHRNAPRSATIELLDRAKAAGLHRFTIGRY